MHLYRIVDAVLDSRIVLDYASQNLDVVPRHTLPAHALMLAVSPLLDERATDALLDLRAHGFDLAVIEVLRSATSPPARRPRMARATGSGS